MFSSRRRYGSPEFSDEESLLTETETDIDTDSELEQPITITMAGSTPKEPVSPETKKKLRPPTPFSGKQEDLRKFLQEVKIYLWGNRSLYPKDNDKILFTISYMGGGDANSWAEEFFEAAEQAAAQTNSPDPILGTYNAFIKKLTDDFSPYDAPKDAIHDMKEMQMNNTLCKTQEVGKNNPKFHQK